MYAYADIATSLMHRGYGTRPWMHRKITRIAKHLEFRSAYGSDSKEGGLGARSSNRRRRKNTEKLIRGDPRGRGALNRASAPDERNKRGEVLDRLIGADNNRGVLINTTFGKRGDTGRIPCCFLASASFPFVFRWSSSGSSAIGSLAV